MKRIFTLLAVVLLTANVLAQAPQTMIYQAVIRNSANALVASTPVGVQISIVQGTADGQAVYVETQSPTTNANGLVSFGIGSGIRSTSGTFSDIDWSAGPYFIKTETDPSGGTSYSITGTSQLMSVPYALYAANSPQGAQGPQGIQGIQGIPGVAGLDGVPGQEGPQGSSAANVLTGIVDIINGGTGSDTKNFVDLTNDQIIAGAKTFSNNTLVNGSVTATSFGLAAGTSSQFLKGDGSVDANSYVPSPEVAGTNGQVLTSDANGVASWKAAGLSESQVADLLAQISLLQSQVGSLNFGAGLFPKTTISNQTWSTTNLDVTTYRDGSPIPQVTDPTEWANLTTGAWCYYGNNATNNEPYGKLYNWYAVNDPRGLAPVGYHVATEADFITLIANNGGENTAGYALKEVGPTHWFQNYTQGSTNSSGFNAVGSGYRNYEGTFLAQGRLVVYQLSDVLRTNDNLDFAPRYKVIRADDGLVFTDWFGFDPSYGFSVRLVKD